MVKKILHINSIKWNSAITEYMVSAHKSLDHLNQLALIPPSCANSKRLDSENISYSALRSFNFFQILNTIRKFKPDIIITYNGSETTSVAIIKFMLFAKFKFFRFRGQAVFNPSILKSFFVRLSYSNISRLICPSKFMINNCETNNINIKTTLLPLGCDESKYYRLDTPIKNNERPQIVILGRFSTVKGHLPALEVFKLLLENYNHSPKPQLVIIGEPTDFNKEFLINKCKDLQLIIDKDVVIIDKKIDNVRSMMQDSAIGWITSIGSEFICRVAYEFLLCGTPIAVSRAGSLPEALAFKDSGIICDIQEKSSAAKSLEKVLISSLAESSQDKTKRAEAAKEYFGRSTMKKHLEKIISD